MRPITVSHEELEQLRALSAKTGLSQSEIVILQLRRILDGEIPLPAPSRKEKLPKISVFTSYEMEEEFKELCDRTGVFFTQLERLAVRAALEDAEKMAERLESVAKRQATLAERKEHLLERSRALRESENVTKVEDDDPPLRPYSPSNLKPHRRTRRQP